MSLSSLSTSVNAFLTALVQRITSRPNTGAMVHAVTDGSGLQFDAAYPLSSIAVVTSNSEENDIRATQSRYIDRRDMTLWENTSGTWVGEPYTGDRPFLKPMTLCLSIPTGRLYYVDAALQLTSVNLTQ